VNNSDVSLGYQFCKNITFILYIIYNVRYNNIYSPFKVCHKWHSYLSNVFNNIFLYFIPLFSSQEKDYIS